MSPRVLSRKRVDRLTLDQLEEAASQIFNHNKTRQELRNAFRRAFWSLRCQNSVVDKGKKTPGVVVLFNKFK